MSDFVYQATVAIIPGDDGRSTVSLTANYPVSVNIHERVSNGRGGERETTAEFSSPNVHVARIVGGGGEGDDLEFGEGVEPDADDDLPIAAEGYGHVPH